MKYAICNELFEGWSFGDTCREIARLGYTGIEIAPFTLAPLVTDILPDQINEIRSEARSAGVEVVGLHWLLAKVEGFHINHPDQAVRDRTADYLAQQVELCGKIGGRVMVFGSPGARKILPGVSPRDAMEWTAETIRRFTPALEEHDVLFCLEPLSTAETNFLNTADQAEQLMHMVDHANVCVHLDVKAMSAESMSIPAIIAKHRDHTGHFHANDPNLRGPGMGDVDFTPIFQALGDTGYDRWVSVEVFDYKPDPVTIARESIEYMRRIESSLGGRS
ncbi:sugar phosphate isomerase/epimerase [bacterium]|jgi:sugar phosphate isomerase/epimerase|nr:sugar phosphate isomerase/epimerase [bacterium]